MKKEYYRIKSFTPTETVGKRYWTFVHICNPTDVKLVIQYVTGEVKGEKEFIDIISKHNYLSYKYTPSEQFLKEYEDTIKRNQSGFKIGFKGYNNADMS